MLMSFPSKQFSVSTLGAAAQFESGLNHHRSSPSDINGTSPVGLLSELYVLNRLQKSETPHYNLVCSPSSKYIDASTIKLKPNSKCSYFEQFTFDLRGPSYGFNIPP